MISYWNVFRSQSDIELECVQEHCSSCQCPVCVLLVLVRSRTEQNRIRTLITQVSYDMLGYICKDRKSTSPKDTLCCQIEPSTEITLKAPITTEADDILNISFFLYFSAKISFDIKYQDAFSIKKIKMPVCYNFA